MSHIDALVKIYLGLFRTSHLSTFREFSERAFLNLNDPQSRTGSDRYLQSNQYKYLSHFLSLKFELISSSFSTVFLCFALLESRLLSPLFVVGRLGHSGRVTCERQHCIPFQISNVVLPHVHHHRCWSVGHSSIMILAQFFFLRPPVPPLSKSSGAQHIQYYSTRIQ